MSVNRKRVKSLLKKATMCEIQHDGWSCGSCFSTLEHELNLKKDIGYYWQAILDFRGDYDDFDWSIHTETDPTEFHDLVDEFVSELEIHYG